MNSRAILDASAADLEEWCVAEGQPKYRAKQIRGWIGQRRAVSFEAMTDLPAALRKRLAEDWSVFGSAVAAESIDRATGAAKLLLRLHDGRNTECVLLTEDDRRTVCMSTQVGCAMGCVFCASGMDGVERNLTVAEMIEQLLLLRNRLPADERLSHVVVMGMGEPLANLDNLLAALKFAASPDGLGISERHITISTVGLPARIRKLADQKRHYHLAVSLHAPNEELRRRIVPTAKKVDLEDLLMAADYFREQTGRQVTFEYVLLSGINDTADLAWQLCRLLEGRDAFVNLIPFNPVQGLPYETPVPERSKDFAAILRDEGINVKIRKRKGTSINAACGQLRRSAAAAPELVQLGAAVPAEGLACR